MAANSNPTRWEVADGTKVDSFIDRARQGVHCSLFCGGSKCKHESWEAFIAKPDANPAIEGLNSNWVGDHVVAAQRPSTSLFIKYPLIQQFKQYNVTGVFNLQEKGEHSSCGPDGIYPSSGYSYDGESDLMRYGVSYYEYPWPDMTAPNNDVVLRSVQVMDYHVRNKGKVLVHCHAGLGRTGLMIACYYLFSQRMGGQEAIELVRRCRKGAVQTSKQVEFVLGFERHLKRLFLVFPREMSDNPVTLPSYMGRQRLFLHGEEQVPFRNVPHHVYMCLGKALRLVKADWRQGIAVVEGLAPSSAPPAATLARIRDEINAGTFNVDSCTSGKVLSFVVMDWFRSLAEPALPAAVVDEMISFIRENDRPTLDDRVTVVHTTMAKYVRHTAAALLSFVEAVVDFGQLTDYHRTTALSQIFNALTLTHSGGRGTLSQPQRDHLIQFALDWCHAVGKAYYVPQSEPLSPIHGGPPDLRHVATIVAASERIFGSSLNVDRASDLIAVGPQGSASSVVMVSPVETTTESDYPLSGFGGGATALRPMQYTPALSDREEAGSQDAGTSPDM